MPDENPDDPDHGRYPGTNDDTRQPIEALIHSIQSSIDARESIADLIEGPGEAG